VLKGKTCSIVGSVYMDMPLKPNVLEDIGRDATARQGNVLGILGAGSGILASLAAVGFPPEVLAQFAGVAAIGGAVGAIIGRRITATELPQMVAALHSRLCSRASAA